MIGAETAAGQALLARHQALEVEVARALEAAPAEERVARLRPLDAHERAELAPFVPAGAPIGIEEVVAIELRFRDLEGRARCGLVHVQRWFSQAAIDALGGLRPGYAERCARDPHRREVARELVEYFRAAWATPAATPLVRCAPWHWCAPLAAALGVDTDTVAMDWDLTSALALRPVAGTDRWSRHCVGAIDLNPHENPMLTLSAAGRAAGLAVGAAGPADLAAGRVEVAPAAAGEWAFARDPARSPLLIHDGSWTRRWFRERAWSWGGDWQRLLDWQHFSPGVE